MPAATVAPVHPPAESGPVELEHSARTASSAGAVPMERPTYLTVVDTNELPTNRGFAMYPSRHTQLVRDLAFMEGRRPWTIIEDALEEYVTRRYVKQYKRK
jgi:hypothetical protein